MQFPIKRIDLGNLKPKEPVTVKFPFEGDKSEIEEVTSSCGCTTPIVHKDYIEVTYNPGEHKGPTSKSIWVYLKSDKPMWVTKDGVKLRNRERPIIDLSLQGVIV